MKEPVSQFSRLAQWSSALHTCSCWLGLFMGCDKNEKNGESLLYPLILKFHFFNELPTLQFSDLHSPRLYSGRRLYAVAILCICKAFLWIGGGSFQPTWSGTSHPENLLSWWCVSGGGRLSPSSQTSACDVPLMVWIRLDQKMRSSCPPSLPTSSAHTLQHILLHTLYPQPRKE